MNCKKRSCCVIFLLAVALFLAPTSCGIVGEKIGVLYIMHSGYVTHTRQHMWNCVAEMFS
jgi:hypothetical protein